MNQKQWLDGITYGTPLNISKHGNLLRGIDHQTSELYKTLRYIYETDKDDEEAVELAFQNFIERMLSWLILDGEPAASESIIIKKIINKYNKENN